MVLKKNDVSLTNLEKVFWPEEGYTKGDLIKYYASVAKIILPHLKNRPMVLNRHPNGIDGESFFQKQVPKNQIPPWIKTFEVQHDERKIEYLIIQNLESLLYVINMGCIELNPFLSRISHLTNPDYSVIDLDPENVPFDKVIEVALTVHDILNDFSIPSYCKTSGGRGLHIYIPLGAKYSFQQSQDFAHLIAVLVQEKHPKLISLLRSPDVRQKQIYVDYLRNSRGQTLAAPYCVRPRKNAPVSTPLEWVELKAGLDPRDFNIETVPQRLQEKNDLFKPVLHKGVDLKRILSHIQDSR